ncbi:MAG: NAD+ synthase, partial [Candidatus Electrothrix sp. AR3]|nr:NAD+ synthase [Candidatus Electrothrix sp. AR3]
MKIALVQTNPIIGNFQHNTHLLMERIQQAEQAECALVIFPELALCGYPPQDLLERKNFLQAHDQALDRLVASVGEIGVILGVVEQRQGPGKPLYNSALLVHQGKVIQRVRKQLLPTYDVFDESRYFEPGDPALPCSFRGLQFGLSICEDIWHEGLYKHDPIATLLQEDTSPDILINISASPYHHGKIDERNQLFSSLCQQHNLPLLYVNQVGGQDSLLFDGHSMAVNQYGEVHAVAAGFQEELFIVDTAELKKKTQ